MSWPSSAGCRDALVTVPVRHLVRAVPILLLVMATDAAADFLPSRPISMWDGRLVVSGEVTVAFGSQDRAYFNALDYSHDAFNLLAVSLAAELRAHDRVAVLAQVVDEVALRRRSFGPTDRHILRPYALYLRVQPFHDRPFHVQAGRIPPVFGRFARQDYGEGNPLIGLPLAYHYPTVMRGDVTPSAVQHLIDNRGNGWRVSYPPSAVLVAGRQGVPLISGRRWDTGVQARVGGGLWEAGIALTAGTLSRPLTDDDNGGKQVSGRVGVTPVTGLIAGASLARGEFVADAARRALTGPAASRTYTQTAWGVDAEYSAGHVLVRGEVIASRWATPFASGEATRGLTATAGWVEGRVTLTPRWHVAVRAERLGFAPVHGSTSADGEYGSSAGHAPGTTGASTIEWDAPVSRVELGAGYRLHRNVRLKVSAQQNWRDGGRIRRDTLVGSQLAYWF